MLLVFTLVSPIIGWVTPKRYRAKILGVYASIGLAMTGIALHGLYLEIFSNGVMYLPSDNAISAILRIDLLGIFMTAIFLCLGIIAIIYSILYIENTNRTPFYYTLVLTLICGMTGIVFAGDLLTLFVFWELMSVSSYALVSFFKERGVSIEAGLKFLIISAAGSATALFGISFLYGLTGTLNFNALALGLVGTEPNSWVYISALFIFIGFGVKAAIFPLHTWLPDTYSEAPAPVSAILSGIVIGPGIFVIIKIFFSAFFSIQDAWAPAIAVLSLITMLFGNIAALTQTDVKRILAYSSIGQVGYMIIGLAVALPSGLEGTFVQFFNHALMKGSAFLCIGAIIYRLGERDLSSIKGVGYRMPITAFAFTISLFALTGLPPLNGFPGELILFSSTIEANMAWLGVALLLNSIISAGFYLRIVFALIQQDTSQKITKIKEAPLLLLVPICILSILIIVFGIWPDPVVNFAKQAVDAIISMGA